MSVPLLLHYLPSPWWGPLRVNTCVAVAAAADNNIQYFTTGRSGEPGNITHNRIRTRKRGNATAAQKSGKGLKGGCRFLENECRKFVSVCRTRSGGGYRACCRRRTHGWTVRCRWSPPLPPGTPQKVIYCQENILLSFSRKLTTNIVKLICYN